MLSEKGADKSCEAFSSWLRLASTGPTAQHLAVLDPIHLKSAAHASLITADMSPERLIRCDALFFCGRVEREERRDEIDGLQGAFSQTSPMALPPR